MSSKRINKIKNTIDYLDVKKDKWEEEKIIMFEITEMCK